jgi:hypothetical protein
VSSNARKRVLNQTLTEALLASALRRLLPRRNDYGLINYPELIEELKTFGVTNLRQLRRLVLQHRREAIRIDREPFDAINARIQREEIGEEQFLYLQRRQIFFSWEALVRIILELHFGDRYREFAEKRDRTTGSQQ